MNKHVYDAGRRMIIVSRYLHRNEVYVVISNMLDRKTIKP